MCQKLEAMLLNAARHYFSGQYIAQTALIWLFTHAMV
jgi:hypothetical protein